MMGLSSPKYYNYSTDKLMAKISYNNYSLIYGKYIINDDFVNYVNEASKSRDGFLHFMRVLIRRIRTKYIFRILISMVCT
jgi:hypothetical protein